MFSSIKSRRNFITQIDIYAKRTQEKLFADWAQQYKAFFVPNQEPASAWIFGNSLVRVGTQGLFCPSWKLSSRLFPFLATRLTAPGSPRMVFTMHRKKMISNSSFQKFSFQGPYVWIINNCWTRLNKISCLWRADQTFTDAERLICETLTNHDILRLPSLFF